jgi:hypothetical protein
MQKYNRIVESIMVVSDDFAFFARQGKENVDNYSKKTDLISSKTTGILQDFEGPSGPDNPPC